MKSTARILGVLAILLVLGTTAVWLARGAHTGWTRTSVTTMEVDEITGLEYPVETERFVPGVEFLGAGVSGAVALGVISLFLGRRKSA